MNKKLIGYIILLIVLSGLLFFQIFRMSHQYSVWKGNYEYMESDNIEVQSWMTVNMINKYFEKEYEEIFEILELSDNWDNRRLVLDEFCQKNEVDCDQIIGELRND